MVKYSRLNAGRFTFMKKNLIRIPDSFSDRESEAKEPFRLAVAGACPGAGASFVSARVLQEGLYDAHTPEGLRTLCELGKPYFYFALGFERRFAGRRFCSFSSHGKHELNMELGYNWYLRKPEEKEAEDREIMKAFYNAAGSFIVFDCSGLCGREVLFDVMDGSDLVYLVVDPMPSKLVGSRDFIDAVRERCPSAELVVNKYCRGIHRRELAAFLGTSDYHTEGFMEAERLYRAEYNCVLP